jgi:hypothetical protein
VTSASGPAADKKAGEFFAGYAAAFSTYDAEMIAEHFTYPLHVASETGTEPTITTAGRVEWRSVLEHLLGAYRALGVTGAHKRIVHVSVLGPSVQLAAVAWTLLRADGSAAYEFEAAYTLVVSQGRLRICAIAHNEQPRLQAALNSS